MEVSMSQNLKKCFMWVCGYLNIVAFALVGGYLYIKSDDEDMKKEVKIALIVTLIFTAITAVLSIYNYCGGFSSAYYGSVAYDVYSICLSVVQIAKIIVYAVFAIMALVKRSDEKKQSTVDVEKDN